VLGFSDDVSPEEWSKLHNDLLIAHRSTVLDQELGNLSSLRGLGIRDR